MERGRFTSSKRLFMLYRFISKGIGGYEIWHSVHPGPASTEYAVSLDLVYRMHMAY